MEGRPSIQHRIFYLHGDKDNDGYSYPEAMSPYNALPDCNDNDANEHPNQIW